MIMINSKYDQNNNNNDNHDTRASSRSMIMINMIKITSYRSMIMMIRPYDDINDVYGLCHHRDADDKDDDQTLFLNARRSCVSKC